MRGFFRPVWTLLACLGGGSVLSAMASACVGSSVRSAAVEPRYVAVHNALRAMGMAEVGPLHDGRLTEGQEAKIDLELEAGCTTFVAIGGGSIADLDAALMNSAGTRVARAATHASDATIRACVPAAGTYALVVKSMRGAGDFIVSSWSGGSPSEANGVTGRAGENSLARGTCEAPFALSAGDVTGSTARGESRNEAKGCPAAKGPELVYRLDLTARQKVTVKVENDGFDAVLYMRKGSCSDQESEIACNDDAPDKDHSRIEEVVDPGTYYVFVDSYNEGKGGGFKMNVDLVDVPALAQLCQSAPLLAEGTPSSGTTEGTFDEANATCGEEAKGPDTVYSFEVEKRSRVRLLEESDDFSPVIHVRSDCTDATTSVGCADSGMTEHEAAFLGILDPGTYAVFADASKREADGKFTVTAETAPDIGSGVRGERCGDAIVLSRSELTVNGDTFSAKDDVAGRCGGTGAPDVVYRFDTTSRTRFTAKLTHEEGAHVFVLLHGCSGGPKAEIHCGKTIDQLLAPGSYYLAVDGESPASFGKFTFEWAARDTRALDAACHATTLLAPDHIVSATTLGSQDKFSPSCVAESDGPGAPDVVYKIVVPSREHIRLTLSTSGWGSVLCLRKACVDGETPGAPSGEVECRVEDAQGVRMDATVDPGTYYVVVDGRETGNAGAFTLQYHVVR